MGVVLLLDCGIGMREYCPNFFVRSPPIMVRSILFIALGGAIGSVSRFLLSRWIQSGVGGGFPWGTMVVNLLGCFLIGLIYALSAKCVSMTDEIRLFLAVGLCGGFTTFSTFSAEALELLRAGQWLYGALYSGGSFFLGLLAVYAGMHFLRILMA